jgi:tRNA (cmo5U34)-methyltransferase
MQPDELKRIFDRQAAGYDAQWARMAPVRDGLYFLLASVFADLPADARLLSVGAGTGAELAYLARAYPGWTFTAVDPSGAMLDVCRGRARAEGFAERCCFHEGYVDSLPGAERYDAATCLLVSQFMVDEQARAAFFRAIASRLRPGGVLATADLAFDAASREYDAALRAWLRVMTAAPVVPEQLERARAAYAKDVAILPPQRVAAIIEAGGFEAPVPFFQAALLHAWFAKRAA